MGFTPKVWANGSNGGTPVNADALNRMEAGIVSAHTGLNQIPQLGFAIPGTHLAFEITQSELDREMNAVKNAGCNWVRFDFAAVQIETTQGVRDWTNMDRIVQSAATRGLNIIGILTTLPMWSAANWQVGPSTATQRNAYVSFAQAAVTRYKDRIKTWEVWNEPNSPGFWTAPSASDYAALLKLTYPAIKTADPTATVLSGGPAGGQSGNFATEPWITSLYTNGCRDFFNGLALHAYPDSYAAGPTSGELSHILNVRGTMAAYNDATKKLWATETGFPTDGSNSATELQQAILMNGIITQWATLTGKQCGPMTIHSLKDQPSQDDREKFFGVIGSTWTVKPAYAAVAAFQDVIPPTP